MLEDMTSHLPVIEIRIAECRGKACKHVSLFIFVSTLDLVKKNLL